MIFLIREGGILDQMISMNTAHGMKLPGTLKKEKSVVPPNAKRLSKASGIYRPIGTQWRTPCFDPCLGKMLLVALSQREFKIIIIKRFIKARRVMHE